jgi:hypothetical protein
MNKIQNKIKELQEKEKIEREKENPDDLLNLI